MFLFAAERSMAEGRDPSKYHDRTGIRGGGDERRRTFVMGRRKAEILSKGMGKNSDKRVDVGR
jgi:hypothetical protein